MLARELVALLIVFAVLCAGVSLVIYGTFAKNRWGINVNPIRHCPHCGESFQRLEHRTLFARHYGEAAPVRDAA
jgi:hypothetical protein